MPDFPPLNTRVPVGQAIRDRIIRRDMRSANWNGGGDLSSGKDATGTAGYLMDYDSGAIQAQALYADGAEITNIDADNITAGILTGTDVVSTNWDGPTPASLPDVAATAGSYFDLSDGNLQLEGGRLFLGNGTSGSPSLTFANDTDLGLYRHSADYLGIKAELIVLTGDLTVGASTGFAYMKQGTGAGNPVYSFNGDSDTGMYRYGANDIAFTAGGTARFRITIGHFHGSNSYSGAITSAASALATPAITFVDDLNTGLHHASADEMLGVAGGTAYWGVDSSSTFSIYNITSDGSDPYLRRDTGTGRVYYDSSARRLKTNIRPLTADDVIDRLEPVEFEMKTGKGGVLYGFIADDVHNVLPYGTSWDGQGRIVNYETRTVLAVTVLELQRLRRRMAALEATR